ncbi:uncharacterized protein MELLADRAFT_70644 [Melampsora larici-populina 98AG31]|uniref:Uncharacterized protein n=1 Tax=Melampsora larici-populina (strain 98AG31 / pathotype 3-4-7) TaxID=747676 RepID=F4R4Z6_MELLP|nr:uncharacterized protein MELLADRAFT_70644 [Melampsora larici-populina 98AG31]EGG11967.1 hypothetical protein MELLADRAFT_70644 [Melampsora larici-populina 98AG31]
MNHTRASLSTIPDSITNPNNSNSIGTMMMGNPGIRKLDQRRPTLDAVMATTTTTSNNSFPSNSHPNGNGVNGSGNSNSTSNICSSASSSNRHNLYPTLPITVNYH